ncbi:hypothetical protein C4J86_4050 [Pseudomonas sp. R2-7-07]|nr:hypothetical protein C4J86_4050 [Pseudomonas sp. R2-7-07]
MGFSCQGRNDSGPLTHPLLKRRQHRPVIQLNPGPERNPTLLGQDTWLARCWQCWLITENAADLM